MKVLGFDIKRQKRLSRSELERKVRYYEAADKGRLGQSFRLARATGANVEVAQALPDLRSRSRFMARNNGWAKRGVEAIVKNTVGEGIRPAPLGTPEVNKRIKEVWRAWAETTECDWYGKTNLYGLQELMCRSVVEGGDAIAILRKTRTGDVPIKIQLLEGDFIDHTKNGPNDKGFARLGIQFNKNSELIGYWLFDQHPGEQSMLLKLNFESNFHAKENVLHVFEVLRIGQVRGVPFGVAAFMKMQDFSDYEEAQLIKQKIASAYSVFVSNLDSQETKKYEYIESGKINYLAAGETVEFPDMPAVGDFDGYSVRILQNIASAFGITYEMLTMDYSKVNFTSGRMAKIDVSANFRSWQYNMMAPQFCAPVWQWFMDACLISGALTQQTAADWTAPRVQQLDPVKETNARLTAVQAGFTTISEIIREDGRDPDEFFEEYAADMKRLQELGITLSSVQHAPDISEQNNNNNEQAQSQ